MEIRKKIYREGKQEKFILDLYVPAAVTLIKLPLMPAPSEFAGSHPSTPVQIICVLIKSISLQRVIIVKLTLQHDDKENLKV